MYCICHGEETPGMIGCDYCDEWYHPQCLNLNKNDVKRLSNENWSCPVCAKKKGKMYVKSEHGWIPRSCNHALHTCLQYAVLRHFRKKLLKYPR